MLSSPSVPLDVALLQHPLTPHPGLSCREWAVPVGGRSWALAGNWELAFGARAPRAVLAVSWALASSPVSEWKTLWG